MTRTLVTSALPYANGPIHFGHIAGAYLPADIWVRYRRLRGDDVLFLCGTDEHGVAITLAAEKEGVPYRAFVDRWHERIAASFRGLRIEFDHFSGTARCRHHAPLSQAFFTNLLRAKYVEEREEKQWFCTKDAMFLADRYVEGTCPACGAPGARGDECGRCGRWLDALALKDARCKVCGSPPEARSTRQWYLDLPRLRAERIGEWFEGKRRRPDDPRGLGETWKDNVDAFVGNMLADLKARSVTRDLRWGVPVPVPGTEGKVLYVWFDAPIGYVSATAEWAEKVHGDPERWREWWCDPGTRLVHFIGKDNLAFHCVVFPAMLHGQGKAFGGEFVLPSNVPAMEFLNLEGRKFSTSGGWYVPLEDALGRYPADALRWTLLAGLPETSDAEFTWADFRRRTNGDLADTVGNLASRVLKFVHQHFEGTFPRTSGEPSPAELDATETARGLLAGIGDRLDAFRFREAASSWIELARLGNRLFDVGKPWSRTRERRNEVAHTLVACVRLLEAIAASGAPFVPDTSARLWAMLGVGEGDRPSRWVEDLLALPDLAGRPTGTVETLFRKIEEREVEEEVARLHSTAGGAGSKAASPAAADGPEPTSISHEDFRRLDLRVARVLAAEAVPKANRLLRLELDLGGETRQVLAGIATTYEPSSLVGRRVVVLANLAPKKMMGLESRGMVLAAEGEGGPVLLGPEREVPPGTPVR